MATEQARIFVIAGARGVADDELHGLAGVEVGDRVGASRR
jgi:hypothetical protein